MKLKKKWKMSSKRELVEKGKELAFLLRHDKEALEKGIIDPYGWRTTEELCRDHGFTEEMLDEIVQTNEKQRYEWEDDWKKKIRARQGHSIKVDVGLRVVQRPPEYLFHGTSDKWLSRIMEEGIKKMTRQHVHLSDNYHTAVETGKRHVHGDYKVVVLLIHTDAMWQDGIQILMSNNGVYLTDYVDPKYIVEYSYDGCFSTPLCGAG